MSLSFLSFFKVFLNFVGSRALNWNILFLVYVRFVSSSIKELPKSLYPSASALVTKTCATPSKPLSPKSFASSYIIIVRAPGKGIERNIFSVSALDFSGVE